MANPRVYIWPAQDSIVICNVQDMVLAGQLIINGMLTSINNSGILPTFSEQGINNVLRE